MGWKTEGEPPVVTGSTEGRVGAFAHSDLHGAAQAAAEKVETARDGQGVQYNSAGKHRSGTVHTSKEPLGLLLSGDAHGAAMAVAQMVTDAALNPVLDSASAFAPVPYPVEKPGASKADQKTFVTKTFKF